MVRSHLTLKGLRVLVTRARDQAGPLTRALQGHGAEVIEMPMIEIRPPKSWCPFDQALARLQGYDWVVFTSANGVRFALNRMIHKGKDVRALQGVRLAAIGPKTGEALRFRGLLADRVPRAFLSPGLLRLFRRGEIAGKRFLLPRGNLAGDLLPRELRSGGARVDEVEVYRTVRPNGSRRILRERVLAGRIDVITFTSSSTVGNFAKILPPRRSSTVLRDVTVACIGPVTAEAAKDFGIPTHIVSKVHTIPGLVDSILEHFRDPGAGGKRP